MQQQQRHFDLQSSISGQYSLKRIQIRVIIYQPFITPLYTIHTSGLLAFHPLLAMCTPLRNGRLRGALDQPPLNAV